MARPSGKADAMIPATHLAFGLLTLTPLAAQPFEVGLFLGRQRSNTFRRDAAPGLTEETDTGDKTFAALRFGFTLGSRGAYDFQAMLGYQPETTASTEVKLGGIPMGSGDLKHNDVASPEAVLKSLAPSWQAGVYAGLRF
jgi:hypothetical protein